MVKTNNAIQCKWVEINIWKIMQKVSNPFESSSDIENRIKQEITAARGFIEV
jgi:hypothetical protein